MPHQLHSKALQDTAQPHDNVFVSALAAMAPIGDVYLTASDSQVLAELSPKTSRTLSNLSTSDNGSAPGTRSATSSPLAPTEHVHHQIHMAQLGHFHLGEMFHHHHQGHPGEDGEGRI
ncbi:hypothetical protein SEPCBS57363_001969 [Sporothrix epigloea]|uniref:Uncharacterized protein n=1 Tax=Sporothrix epigloea TaxID=1892477 RepID=A0ABP0DER9_9PEZI